MKKKSNPAMPRWKAQLANVASRKARKPAAATPSQEQLVMMRAVLQSAEEFKLELDGLGMEMPRTERGMKILLGGILEDIRVARLMRQYGLDPADA